MTTLPTLRRYRFLLASLLASGAMFNPAHAVAAPQPIQNDVFWKDTSGNPIYSQGGGILKVGDTYYWYGAKYDGAVSYAKTGEWQKHPRFNAVTAYSSTDLVNWKFEGDVIKAAATGKVFERDAWVGRMGVVYNSSTRKYVLLTQYGSASMGGGVLFATSDSPAGPFVFERLQKAIDNVATPATGDQTVFIDDDGQPWLVFSSAKGRSHLYVARLRPSDYLAVEPATNIYNSPAGGREGNAVFKYKGVYYFCSSDLHGWNASHTYYMTADKITGPYSAEAVMPGTEADFSHVSQTGFFVPVQGKQGTTILFAGDRWSDFAGNGLGYNQWMPLSFDGTTPVFHSLSQFTLDADQGTWAPGSGNNHVRNPSFEADRVTQTSLAGWVTSWSSLADTSPVINALGGHTGRWAMTLNHTATTQGDVLQNISLPDGSYTLKVWARSSGGQSAKLYVDSYGGVELARPLDAKMDSWTELAIPHIAVARGRVRVGVHSDGKAGQWLQVDDFSLVRE